MSTIQTGVCALSYIAEPEPPGLIEPFPCLPDDILLERDPELMALGQRFAALCTGSSSGGCVLLSGEAGVGKTTVLRAAARRTVGRIDWLWGTCEPMLSPTPLGPLVDWLDRMPPALAAAVRAGHHTAEVLSGVLSMLRDATTPAVLLVDDAQWADSATLDQPRRCRSARRLDREIGTAPTKARGRHAVGARHR